MSSGSGAGPTIMTTTTPAVADAAGSRSVRDDPLDTRFSATLGTGREGNTWTRVQLPGSASTRRRASTEVAPSRQAECERDHVVHPGTAEDGVAQGVAPAAARGRWRAGGSGRPVDRRARQHHLLKEHLMRTRLSATLVASALRPAAS